mgnify:CR=1 FL=1
MIDIRSKSTGVLILPMRAILVAALVACALARLTQRAQRFVTFNESESHDISSESTASENTESDYTHRSCHRPTIVTLAVVTPHNSGEHSHLHNEITAASAYERA